MAGKEGISLERGVLAAMASWLFALALAVGLTALRISPAVAFAIAAMIAAAAWRPTASRLSREFDGAAGRHRLGGALWLLLAVVALLRVSGVALFMADAEHPEYSAWWFDGFYIQHNCFSAWWKAAVLAGDPAVSNVYESELYAGMEGRFKLDDFLYLPQFLILPQAGVATGADFLQLRAAWFALEAGSLAAIMLALCTFVGGAVGRRAALALPAVWLATPTVLTLQIGNFQIAAIALSILAMIAFERGRHALGGALLGFALFKIFPGLLGVYLVAKRQWRPVFATAAACGVYSVIAYLAFGRAPFDAFLHHELPKIASGDAWSWLENEGMGAVVAINDSVPGLVLKLGQLGVGGMTRQVEVTLSMIWTLVAVALAVLAALRSTAMSTAERALAWLALLAVAAFRSPFVPDTYGLFPLLWIWSLLAAIAAPGRGRIALLALLWIPLAASLPFSGMPLPDLTGRLVLSTVSQAVAVAVCLWVLLRRPARTTEAIALPSDAAAPTATALAQA